MLNAITPLAFHVSRAANVFPARSAARNWASQFQNQTLSPELEQGVIAANAVVEALIVKGSNTFPEYANSVSA